MNVILPHVRSLKKSGEISSHVADQLINPESEKFNEHLVEALIRHICLNEGDGAILIFVPGLSDIQKIQKLLHRDFYSNCKLRKSSSLWRIVICLLLVVWNGIVGHRILWE